ncbi:MAG: twin-arginine translocation signal domain-containing protein [Chitinispirillaceae bacterium]|nr:twin-arginine translocation signal domain-containing protein [Chitinispirillaceae bacterium]
MAISRRDFLKSGAAGTAGLAIGGLHGVSEASSGGWTNGMAINPAIDNLRVVCCHDTRMIKSTPTRWDFTSQNAAVNKEIVQMNLDEMAKTLAQKSTAAEAWAAIFRKPASKEWNQVKVALKVNCIEYRNMPRIALLDGIARRLIALGVTPANIVIYDGCHNAYSTSSSQPKYNSDDSRSQLPDGIVVSTRSDSLGGTVSSPVPNMSNAACTRQIADGTVDILVNFALNKGHSSGFGTATLTMKNHAGTFDPNGLHGSSSTNYLFNINKSAAILGGNPVRQQLCVLDSLFASVSGPTVVPDQAPARIVMGTFGPAVDYLTVKRIREPVMQASHNATVVNRFLTEFGYQTSQLTDFVPVDPVSIREIKKHLNRINSVVLFNLANGKYQPASLSLHIPDTERISTAAVYDVKGKRVRKLDAIRDRFISWDGLADAGTPVMTGTYVVRVTTNNRSYSDSMSVVRR